MKKDRLIREKCVNHHDLVGLSTCRFDIIRDGTNRNQAYSYVIKGMMGKKVRNEMEELTGRTVDEKKD